MCVCHWCAPFNCGLYWLEQMVNCSRVLIGGDLTVTRLAQSSREVALEWWWVRHLRCPTLPLLSLTDDVCLGGTLTHTHKVQFHANHPWWMAKFSLIWWFVFYWRMWIYVWEFRAHQTKSIAQSSFKDCLCPWWWLCAQGMECTRSLENLGCLIGLPRESRECTE